MRSPHDDDPGDLVERAQAIPGLAVAVAAGAPLAERSEQFARAQQQLRDMVRDLVAEGAAAGGVRDDVAAGELASYCLHAIAGAAGLPSKAAVRPLVIVTLAGLRPVVQRPPAAVTETCRSGSTG
ncbi:MAG: hypothetical protein ACRD1K_04265 [Acidimicrobiales bacterium]